MVKCEGSEDRLIEAEREGIESGGIVASGSLGGYINFLLALMAF